MTDKNSWRMTRLSRNSPNMRLVTMLSLVRALRAHHACLRGFPSGRTQEPLPIGIITRPPYEGTGWPLLLPAGMVHCPPLRVSHLSNDAR